MGLLLIRGKRCNMEKQKEVMTACASDIGAIVN